MKSINGARISLLLLFLVGIMACKMDDNGPPSPVMIGNSGNNEPDTASNKPLSNKLRIRVGSTTFTATLLENATVTAFKARLPMTVSMSELNGNEKLYNFPTGPNAGPLPTNSSNPGTIQTGDLMLYGSSTLVLFYKTFPTAYSYTKLGQIDKPAGLETALGSGSVTVSFDLL
ncbi:cyclophilin-like fold protein [Spirosoma endbachense]|uniref:Cyclophilin-like domain-containing protein n=1 Tax=Spirosoma endbachense TaxID=2666025 RepID=A0A6P1W676_9BACT|nr:cyclophilin-like fold protein [Spirosoma endbachense]QHW00415.1 hypothetical protein GJR95_37715 [Spirosoma endbachense]